MNKYEVAVVLHPDLEIDLEAPLKRLEDTLKGVHAKVLKRDEWGKRKLAYKIAKQSFGVYVFYVIELDPTNVGELERALRLNEEVIRHLVVNYEEYDSDKPDEEKEEKPKDTKKATKSKAKASKE